MLRWLSQTLAVSALSVRTIPQRASSSAVAMVGIAGVVIVFVAVLSIGEGFRALKDGMKDKPVEQATTPAPTTSNNTTTDAKS